MKFGICVSVVGGDSDNGNNGNNNGGGVVLARGKVAVVR